MQISPYLASVTRIRFHTQVDVMNSANLPKRARTGSVSGSRLTMELKYGTNQYIIGHATWQLPRSKSNWLRVTNNDIDSIALNILQMYSIPHWHIYIRQLNKYDKCNWATNFYLLNYLYGNTAHSVQKSFHNRPLNLIACIYLSGNVPTPPLCDEEWCLRVSQGKVRTQNVWYWS